MSVSLCICQLHSLQDSPWCGPRPRGGLGRAAGQSLRLHRSLTPALQLPRARLQGQSPAACHCRAARAAKLPSNSRWREACVFWKAIWGLKSFPDWTSFQLIGLFSPAFVDEGSSHSPPNQPTNPSPKHPAYWSFIRQSGNWLRSSYTFLMVHAAVPVLLVPHGPLFPFQAGKQREVGYGAGAGRNVLWLLCLGMWAHRCMRWRQMRLQLCMLPN